MENSFSKTSKKKQFNKNTSLTSVESLKTPKIRRKSLGTVLPTPSATKQPLESRRKSIAAIEKPETTKKQKNVDSSNLKSTNHKEGKNQHVKQILENSPSPTPKKAAKRRTSESIEIPLIKKQEKLKLKKSKPLVLAPAKEVEETATKKSKKQSKKVPKQKIPDQVNVKSNTGIGDLEKQFKIEYNNVENAVKGVIRFASNNPHLQNQLFNEEVPLFLQINSFKIPKTYGHAKRLFKVPMKHSTLPSDADICLIVPDVKGIKNNEHEKHLEHYENLLRSKDVTGIKKIMTFHEFRTDYETFELKRRLADLYDVFLVDGKISGKVVQKCGSIFYQKRKVPTALKLHHPKLNSQFDQALKKAYFHLNEKSDSNMIQIGHSKMDTKDLVENVYSVIEFLDKQFPGKMDNIRSLNLYAHRGSSIPIYLSLKNPNDIKVPTISNKKPKAYKSFTGELTTQYNANVVVRPSGHVIVKRSKAPIDQIEENPDDNITDAEILKENKVIDKLEQENGDGLKKNKNSKKRKLSESDKKEEITNKENSSLQADQTDLKIKKAKKTKTPKPEQQNIFGDRGDKADKKSNKKKSKEGIKSEATIANVEITAKKEHKVSKKNKTDVPKVEKGNKKMKVKTIGKKKKSVSK